MSNLSSSSVINLNKTEKNKIQGNNININANKEKTNNEIANKIKNANKDTFLKSNLSMFFELFNGIKINNTIKVVCHSGLMKDYFKKKNGSTDRIKELNDTNVWSFKEKIGTNTFMVSRHAFTVANMFKEKRKVLNQISESDTSLSCYGILSTLLKAKANSNNFPILNMNQEILTAPNKIIRNNQPQNANVNNTSPVITISNNFDNLNSNLSSNALLLKIYLMETIGEKINYIKEKSLNDTTKFGIVFYKKETNNAKKNFSRLWKKPSGYVKILKISRKVNINEICNKLAIDMTKSITGSCIGSKIRLRLKDNNEYCIPDNHEYIFKSEDNTLQIGDIVEITSENLNNKYTWFKILEKFENKNLNSEKIYVSVLIRTWMTAICLYLPSCKSDKLILEVSPYLKEEGMSSDNKPLAFQKQKEQIIKFIKFLYNLHIKDTGKYKKISQTLDSFRFFFDKNKKLIINQNYYGKIINIDINIIQVKQKINNVDLSTISSDYILYNLDLALQNKSSNSNSNSNSNNNNNSNSNSNNNSNSNSNSNSNNNRNSNRTSRKTLLAKTNEIIFYPGITKPSKEYLNKLSRWCEPFSRKDLFIKDTCKFTINKNNNENNNENITNQNRNSTSSMNSYKTAKSRNSNMTSRETILARHNSKSNNNSNNN